MRESFSIHLLRSSNALGLLIVAWIAGCGGDGIVTKQVEGTLTFQGAPPPTSGKISLAPLEAQPPFPSRPARGEFDQNGKFRLTTFEADDGVIPGRYLANITCWREIPTLETKLSANYVPPDFRHEVTIDADAEEPIELHIDVPNIQRGK